MYYMSMSVYVYLYINHLLEVHGSMLSCFSLVQLFVTTWTVTLQASLVCGILQAILEWLPHPSPRGLPDLGIEPMVLLSPALAGRFFTTSTT